MDIVEEMRGFEIDHEPDGWPAVRMRQITALCDEIERLRWISVGERLPEMDTPVWLYEPGRGGWVGERSDTGDGWLWGNTYGSHYMRSDGTWSATTNDQDDDYQPTHWMALPGVPPNFVVNAESPDMAVRPADNKF